jgi:hypothetical protein
MEAAQFATRLQPEAQRCDQRPWAKSRHKTIWARTAVAHQLSRACYDLMRDTTEAVLFMAFELSENTWKLGFSLGHGHKPRARTMAARDLKRLRDEVAQAKTRFGLCATAPVVSCYETGRDGFWLPRFLQAQGIANSVVDSSSLEVNRRQRRAKSDGLDVRKLLSMLRR